MEAKRQELKRIEEAKQKVADQGKQIRIVIREMEKTKIFITFEYYFLLGALTLLKKYDRILLHEEF